MEIDVPAWYADLLVGVGRAFAIYEDCRRSPILVSLLQLCSQLHFTLSILGLFCFTD